MEDDGRGILGAPVLVEDFRIVGGGDVRHDELLGWLMFALTTQCVRPGTAIKCLFGNAGLRSMTRRRSLSGEPARRGHNRPACAAAKRRRPCLWPRPNCRPSPG